MFVNRYLSLVMYAHGKAPQDSIYRLFAIHWGMKIMTEQRTFMKCGLNNLLKRGESLV
ncbi:hypothetical protein J28TS4_56480 [Paenibacillus lautus]|nr:hypothetical protein J28TS4_56480 [Paenibacillus lautus]